MTSVPDRRVLDGGSTPVRRRGRFAVVLAAVWLVVPIALFLLDRSVLLAGHPAHVAALATCVLVGVVLLARERLGAAPSRPGRTWLRTLGRAIAVLLTVVVLGALVWLRPFPAAHAAVAAMAGGAGVRVTDAPTQIVIAPTSGTPTRGLVFQPGARVDPRAYVPMLSEVSRQGVLVVVVKQPFDIGFLAIDAPASAIAAHPEVRAWAVGGHSLGGVAASSYAGSHASTVRGLVLWASYPLDSLAQSGLRVASVSGSADALATPADIEASRADLPSDTAYTVVEGGVHAFFGDYGEQPGDGTPGVSREEAQRQIVEATAALMASLPAS